VWTKLENSGTNGTWQPNVVGVRSNANALLTAWRPVAAARPPPLPDTTRPRDLQIIPHLLSNLTTIDCEPLQIIENSTVAPEGRAVSSIVATWSCTLYRSELPNRILRRNSFR